MRTTKQKQQWMENRKLDTKTVLNRLPDDVRQFAYVVGVWVWIEFPEKPEHLTLDALKILAFHGIINAKFGSILADISGQVHQMIPGSDSESLQLIQSMMMI